MVSLVVSVVIAPVLIRPPDRLGLIISLNMRISRGLSVIRAMSEGIPNLSIVPVNLIGVKTVRLPA